MKVRNIFYLVMGLIIIGTLSIVPYTYITVDCDDIGNSTMTAHHYTSGFINGVEYDYAGNVTIYFIPNSSMPNFYDRRINTTILKFVNCTIPIKEHINATLFFDMYYIYSPMGYIPDVHKHLTLVDVKYL